MVTVHYQQMRNWLAGFPFVMQEGMWKDLKMTGATLRAKSWNAVSLMPVVAERQLSNVGMPLPTYRNQVAFFDMFGEENGSTNFNIAVTGTSGAGKSFLTQGILRDVLNAGGYAWVPRKSDLRSPIADEIVTFFGNGLPIATPTAFVVNVNTLKAYPLTQGVMDIPALESRMASLIQADMDNVDPKALPPMLASTQVTPQ